MLRNRPALAVSIAVAFGYLGAGMISPVFVLYAQARGASLEVIGAMASAYLLGNVLFQYPAGWTADRWGRRRLMIAGLAVDAALSLLYLAVKDPLLFIGLRFIEGAAASAFLPPARAVIADVVPENERGQAYGIFSSFLNAGLLLGPPVGGGLAALGYPPSFIAACAARLVGIVVVALLVPETIAKQEDSQVSTRVRWTDLFTPALVGAYFLVFGDYLYLGFDLTVMPLWLRHQVGVTPLVIGIIFALWAIPNILLAPFAGKLADRGWRLRQILVFGALQTPAYLAYSLTTAAWAVASIVTLHGATYALLQPAVDAYVAACSPPSARARVQSVYSTVGVASAFLSSSVMPALYGVDYRVPLWTLAAGFATCLVLGAMFVIPGERRIRASGVAGTVASLRENQA